MDTAQIKNEQAQMAVVYEKNQVILQLSERNDALFAENDNLKNTIVSLESMIAELKEKVDAKGKGK